MMKKLIICVVTLICCSLTAAAIEVKLHDGTVITAESYKVTGSFILLTLANGQKVAYSLADVDTSTLPEEVAAPDSDTAEAEAVPQQQRVLMGGNAFGQAVTSGDEQSAYTVTDQDVGHVDPSRVAAGEEEDEEGEESEGAGGGGSVGLAGFKVEEIAVGQFRVEGRVVNRSSAQVVEVRVILTAMAGDEELSKAELPVAGVLGPQQDATFTHIFRGEAGTPPQVQTRLTWMAAQEEGEGEGESDL